MTKGDIILVPFPFTDLSAIKNRPALVLIVTDKDVTVAFITSQFKWEDLYDLKIEPSDSNGLKKTFLIRLNKITTIDRDIVIGRLGILSSEDVKIVNYNLIRLLRLQ